eukprot:gene44526-66897_t
MTSSPYGIDVGTCDDLLALRQATLPVEQARIARLRDEREKAETYRGRLVAAMERAEVAPPTPWCGERAEVAMEQQRTTERSPPPPREAEARLQLMMDRNLPDGPEKEKVHQMLLA